jgi:predicted RNase H-like nuclease (RuvC/YqgF family)
MKIKYWWEFDSKYIEIQELKNKFESELMEIENLKNELNNIKNYD